MNGAFGHQVKGVPGPSGQQEWQAQLRRKPDAPKTAQFQKLVPVRAASPEGAIAVAQEMHLGYEVVRVSEVN